MSQPTLLIFVKAPVAGRVKTRLSPPLTAAEAAALYRACAADTVVMARGLARRAGWGCRIVYDAHPAAPTPSWLDRRCGWMPQRGRTLGQRLLRAGAEAFAGGAGPLVIIGSDAPGLTAARFHQAFAALRRRDVVLGPATDGGYYLIGVRRHQPALFRGIDWSTDRVLAQTLVRARALRLRVAQLSRETDLDTWADVIAWRRRAHVAAPRTRRLVAALWRRYGGSSCQRMPRMVGWRRSS